MKRSLNFNHDNGQLTTWTEFTTDTWGKKMFKGDPACSIENIG